VYRVVEYTPDDHLVSEHLRCLTIGVPPSDTLAVNEELHARPFAARCIAR